MIGFQFEEFNPDLPDSEDIDSIKEFLGSQSFRVTQQFQFQRLKNSRSVFCKSRDKIYKPFDAIDRKRV